MDNKLQKFIESLELVASKTAESVLSSDIFGSAVTNLLSDAERKENMEKVFETLSQVISKVEGIDSKLRDYEFFNSYDGKRMLKIGLGSIYRDSRREKIDAMVNLLTNLHLKTKLSYDEREQFVKILDDLSPIQLAVLGRIHEFITKEKITPRKFEASGISSYFEDRGFDRGLIYNSIEKLSNHYLINRQTGGSIGDGSLGHYYTEYGEKFYIFITQVLTPDSSWLLINP